MADGVSSVTCSSNLLIYLKRHLYDIPNPPHYPDKGHTN